MKVIALILVGFLITSSAGVADPMNWRDGNHRNEVRDHGRRCKEYADAFSRVNFDRNQYANLAQFMQKVKAWQNETDRLVNLLNANYGFEAALEDYRELNWTFLLLQNEFRRNYLDLPVPHLKQQWLNLAIEHLQFGYALSPDPLFNREPDFNRPHHGREGGFQLPDWENGRRPGEFRRRPNREGGNFQPGNFGGNGGRPGGNNPPGGGGFGGGNGGRPNVGGDGRRPGPGGGRGNGEGPRPPRPGNR